MVAMDNGSKILILLAIGFVLLGGILAAINFWPAATSEVVTNSLANSDENNQRQVADYFNIPQKQTADIKVEVPKTLFFVGDMMLSRWVGAKATKQGDWVWPFLPIKDFLAGADLTVGNLEGVISDKGHNVGSAYSFRAAPQMIQGLQAAGFDLVTLANNHVGDWTRVAFEDCLNRLIQVGIGFFGTGWNFSEAHQATIAQVGDVKIGFLAYTNIAPAPMYATDKQSGVAKMDLAQLVKDVVTAKQQADIVVVQMHVGVEYAAHPNKTQQDFAHTAIDAGADLVVGHHPHVIQDLEQYQNKYIAYSLGNFIFDQDFSQETSHGWMLKVLVKDKKIVEVTPIDVYISKDFQVGLQPALE